MILWWNRWVGTGSLWGCVLRERLEAKSGTDYGLYFHWGGDTAEDIRSNEGKTIDAMVLGSPGAGETAMIRTRNGRLNIHINP